MNDGIRPENKAALVDFRQERAGRRGALSDRGTEPLVVGAVITACGDGGAKPMEVDGGRSLCPELAVLVATSVPSDRLGERG